MFTLNNISHCVARSSSDSYVVRLRIWTVGRDGSDRGRICIIIFPKEFRFDADCILHRQTHTFITQRATAAAQSDVCECARVRDGGVTRGIALTLSHSERGSDN